MQHSFRALSSSVKGLTLLEQDSALGSETCAAGDSPSAAPPTVAANSADSSEELEKLRKDVERLNADNDRLRVEVERLRGENKQLNERLRFDPRQAVSEWLSRCMHLQPAGGVAAAAAEEAVVVREVAADGVAAAAEEAVAVRETAAESAAGECTFWFVSASHIRSLDLTTTITLPSFQELFKPQNASGPSVLEQRTLNLPPLCRAAAAAAANCRSRGVVGGGRCSACVRHPLASCPQQSEPGNSGRHGAMSAACL